jgi:hypothetical protein
MKAMRAYMKKLQALHDVDGLYHLDCKPENATLDPTDPDHAKIIDLGLAESITKIYNSDPPLKGSLRYLPPNCKRLGGNLQDRDRYGISLMLAEALNLVTIKSSSVPGKAFHLSDAIDLLTRGKLIQSNLLNEVEQFQEPNKKFSYEELQQRLQVKFDHQFNKAETDFAYLLHQIVQPGSNSFNFSLAGLDYSFIISKLEQSIASQSIIVDGRTLLKTIQPFKETSPIAAHYSALEIALAQGNIEEIEKISKLIADLVDISAIKKSQKLEQLRNQQTECLSYAYELEHSINKLTTLNNLPKEYSSWIIPQTYIDNLHSTLIAARQEAQTSHIRESKAILKAIDASIHNFQAQLEDNINASTEKDRKTITGELIDPVAIIHVVGKSLIN